MSILNAIARFVGQAVSPTFRKDERFRSMMVHPDALDLYDDFIGLCAGQTYAGRDFPGTVGSMVQWMGSRFGKGVCADLHDLRIVLENGGWNLPVDEQTEIHPALFDAIALATRGQSRWIPESIQTREQAATFVDGMMRRGRQ